MARGRDESHLPSPLTGRAGAAAEADHRLDHVEAAVRHVLVVVRLQRQLLVAVWMRNFPPFAFTSSSVRRFCSRSDMTSAFRNDQKSFAALPHRERLAGIGRV
jgi:hypothetical protein